MKTYNDPQCEVHQYHMGDGRCTCDSKKIDVLPCFAGTHGFIRLVDHLGNDLSIVRAARVSYDADWRVGINEDKDEKLIRYLWTKHHTSPFESVKFTFEVKAPIFVFRQWHRHRTWAYNEISARYAVLDEGFYVPDLDQITTQSSSNKQMRTDEQHAEASSIQSSILVTMDHSSRIYRELIERGAPRELARAVLPVGAYSRMFATVDLHNLFHFLNLRLHSHSQYEIRVYAEAILELIRPIVPYAVAAFEDERELQKDMEDFYKRKDDLLDIEWKYTELQR